MPDAVPLVPIWSILGPMDSGNKIGREVEGLPGVFGEGRNAWAVYAEGLDQWRIYYHDPHDSSHDISNTVTPIHVFDTVAGNSLIVGHFSSTSERSIGVFRFQLDTTTGAWLYSYQLRLYRAENGRIADSPFTVLDTRAMSPRRYSTGPDAILSADLNRDGYDELILVHGGIRLDSGTSEYPEMWIFKGGPNFSLASEPVIIKHPYRNGIGPVHATIGDFDGDQWPDILLSRGFSELPFNHITFYWGSDSIEHLADEKYRRIVDLTPDLPTAEIGVTALDCDGDGITDIAVDKVFLPNVGTWLFRSGAGWHARTDGFDSASASKIFIGRYDHASGGFLNDSSQRYEMLVLGKAEFDTAGAPSYMLFSGGSDGPENSYAAYITPSASGRAIPDADGDGWADYITGDPTASLYGGRATIYHGGPYIPLPHAAGVDAIAGEGHDQAITVWPLPAGEQVHVAWRGDLHRMPSRFIVYDMLGDEIIHATADPMTGSAILDIGTAPPGIYFVTILDRNDLRIATKRIIKQ
ncbi:MAG: T9SS type A sorting domain-containing protein [Bacteroidetes bacterium]|nr:T9SS type A sorting domain-containing protein [Bacteroidota bacterium]